jgi:hypothetical protein
MKILNRAAFIVRPRDGYLRWAASLDADAYPLIKHLQQRVSVYLVPENARGDAETPPLEDYFEQILDMELEAWSRDESQWPKDLDFATFKEWFDVDGESMVIDLADDRLEAEEM